MPPCQLINLLVSRKGEANNQFLQREQEGIGKMKKQKGSTRQTILEGRCQPPRERFGPARQGVMLVIKAVVGNPGARVDDVHPRYPVR